MTAKEYLNRLVAMHDLIMRKKQRLETLRAVVVNTTCDFTKEAVQLNGSNQMMENMMAKVIDLDREIKAMLTKYVDLKAEVWECLDKLYDETQKRILWLRYAENKTWKWISKEVCFTPRYVRKLHVKALENLDKILFYEKKTM